MPHLLPNQHANIEQNPIRRKKIEPHQWSLNRPQLNVTPPVTAALRSTSKKRMGKKKFFPVSVTQMLTFYTIFWSNCRYATVKKEPPARPPAPARRRQRSSKSLGGQVFKDSPFPERQARGVIAPARPPRRGSSSSLIDTHKYMKQKTEFLTIDI